jgi:hypothetical protein
MTLQPTPYLANQACLSLYFTGASGGGIQTLKLRITSQLQVNQLPSLAVSFKLKE